jgi:hypothetical protein
MGYAMKARILAAAVTILCSAGAVAGGDGNELLNACQSMIEMSDSDGARGSEYKTGYCVGVISGVTSLTWVINYTFSKGTRLCVPDNMTNIQAARIIVKWLKDNPKYLSNPDGHAAMMALRETYPCN